MTEKNICVVICTKDRASDLYVTLRSILSNTILPSKIIIVDSSDRSNDTMETINKIMQLIKTGKMKIDLIYVYRDKLSLTQARNYALEYVKDCDIIGFLDDDIIIHKTYFEEIMNVFSRFNDVYGVQGVILNSTLFGLKINGLHKLLLYLETIYPSSSFSLYKPEVNIFLRNKYPLYPFKSKIIESKWISGCNMFYRREIFFKYNFRFDNRLYGYSLGEDMDFSYRVYLHGFRLVMASNAYLIHKPLFYYGKSKYHSNTNISIKNILAQRLMYLGYRFYFYKKIYKSFFKFFPMFFLYYIFTLIYYLFKRKNIYIIIDTHILRVILKNKNLKSESFVEEINHLLKGLTRC